MPHTLLFYLLQGNGQTTPKPIKQAATSDEDSEGGAEAKLDQIIQGDVGGSHRGSKDKSKQAGRIE